MDVFVIPIGRDRYELYCEAPVAAADTEVPADSGWLARMRVRFAEMVREAEERKASGQDRPSDDTLWGRTKQRLLAWIAERIAEQRLLWNLRREDAAALVYPSDMTVDQSMTLVRRILKRDHDRHRIWLSIHTVLFVLSGVLFFVPGPNVVAYYFAFRAVGHLLSMRGAAQGLHRIAWTGRASDRLVDLRAATVRAAGTAPAELRAIADDLGLPKLAAFVERLAPQ